MPQRTTPSTSTTTATSSVPVSAAIVSPSNMVDDSFGLTARDMVQQTSVHTGQLSVGIAKNGIGRSAASLSLTIQQEACQAALDAYNQKNRTNYKPIPSSLVNLDKAQLSFGADEVVKEVTLSWNVTDAAELIGEDTDYVIPVLVNSKELQVNPDRNLLLVNLIRSSVSVRQKSIARTVDETKVLPGPDGEQPELKESFILDIELDNPIKNVGITFPLVVDNSLIEVFNQDQDVPYVAAPEGLVTLDTPSAGISESDKSCTIRLTLDKGVLMEGDELPAFPNYLIPIRLDAQNASATYKGKNFDLRGLSFGNLVTYIGITYEEIKNYVKFISEGSEKIVSYYKEGQPIFDHFLVTKQIKSSFGRTVNFQHGAYLIIEQTEALCVIDVNSGNRLKNNEGQEENALQVNLGAADEIARQLRLRDVGGIIVIDFIDMDNADNRKLLYDRMMENMKNDRSRHNILPLSKFCLMQITRQRVRPVLDIDVEEECPSCFGTGKIRPSILFTDTLEEKIKSVKFDHNISSFRLHVHPYVAAYINKGIYSLKWKWKLTYGMGIHIVADQSMAFLQYMFKDSHGNEIDVTEEKDLKTPSKKKKDTKETKRD